LILLRGRPCKPTYDLILIDEGQDFPDGFYDLCFFLAKGERDRKQIVWAYDELQSVFDVTVSKPEELFGTDADGEPRISLGRSLCPTLIRTISCCRSGELIQEAAVPSL